MDLLASPGHTGHLSATLLQTRDHEIETVSKKVIHGLRKHVDLNRELVLENRFRDWMNLARRVAAGAEDNGASFRQVAQERFSDLSASRIAGAQEQDAEAIVRHNAVLLVCRGGELRV